MAEIDLEALAARAVQADPIMQGALLEEAWEALAEHSAEFRRFAVSPSRRFDNKAAKFCAALEAMAFESAAMMLVPERAWVRLDQWPSDFCAPVASVMPIVKEEGNQIYTATGSTLALALTAAALRARLMEGEGE